MDGQKQIVDKLKDANNILVTVQSDPTIDALSACIGLTLLLNEMGKHATAVFSGQVPHVLEFLQPEKTIETNTNSLRDFIISLDKSKADKLRYKVEDKVVKIFITPYKTSITDRDLEFSQGDFNVDVVIAIGVHAQDELDQAVTAHGRILHDATVLSVNTTEGEKLGSVNWVDKEASSLSEMAASLVDPLAKDKLDNQIATAFLTGIVEQTERFSNNKTSPKTMSISAKLLTAGANQELVASKLAEPEPDPEPIEEPLPRHEDVELPVATEQQAVPAEPRKAEPGTLEIDHTHDDPFADILPEAPQQHADPAHEPQPAPAQPAEERDPFEEDERQRPKRLEPLPNVPKEPLHMPEEDPAALDIPKPMDVAQPPAAKPEEPAPAPAEPTHPDVSDEAVAALRELQKAHASKVKDGDAAKNAALAEAAEKAAEDYLRAKQINIDDQGHLRLMTPEHRQFLGGEGKETADVAPAPEEKTAGAPAGGSNFVLSPPSLGGTLTANSRPDDLQADPTTDPLSMPKSEKPMLSHDAPAATPEVAPARDAAQQAADAAPSASNAHADLMAAAEQAITNPTPATPEPLAQPYTEPEQPAAPAQSAPEPAQMPVAEGQSAGALIEPLGSEDQPETAADQQAPDKPLDMPLPPSLNLPAPNVTPATASSSPSPTAPPPVPPPMMPPLNPPSH